MKIKLLVFLMCLCTMGVWAQPQMKRCDVCKKPVLQCAYKGSHPKCKTCGKLKVKCQYKGNHPKPGKPTESVSVSTGVELGGHYWVDMGLPSGTKWATTNVGAKTPSDFGQYFAWGETSPKKNYTWKTYKFSLDVIGEKFSKYVNDPRDHGPVDGKKVLERCDDAAYVNWGSDWCMPTEEQMAELEKCCTWTNATIKGHKGYKVVGQNGNSIFLPFAGFWMEATFYAPEYWDDQATHGNYWSSTYNYTFTRWASSLFFRPDHVSSRSFGDRYQGYSIRPVLAPLN